MDTIVAPPKLLLLSNGLAAANQVLKTVTHPCDQVFRDSPCLGPSHELGLHVC